MGRGGRAAGRLGSFAISLLVASGLNAGVAVAPVAAASATGRGGHYTTLRTASHIDLKTARPAAAGTLPDVRKPQLSPRHGRASAPKGRAQASRVRTVTAASATKPGATSSLTSSSTPQILTSFDGAGYESGICWLGENQADAPADTQIAAGIQNVVEMVNSSESVWTKTGTLLHTFDLNTLFPVPTGYRISDPWVVWFKGTYYASAVAIDNRLDSQLYLAVSSFDDPTVWTTYVVKTNTGSIVYDQPKLGVSSYADGGQATLVWEDFNCSQAGCPFLGEEIFVADPSFHGLDSWSYGPDPNRFGSFPVQLPTGASDNQYLVFNASDPDVFTVGPTPVLGLSWINGHPAQIGSAALGNQLISMRGTHIPPDALQGGGGRPIGTNDDRIISAVMDAGGVWIAAEDGCTPSGAADVRSCLRLLHVTTGNTIDQDFDLSEAGKDLYFPALARAYSAPLNGFTNGYLYLVYNRSSLGESPGLFANSFPTANPGSFLGEVILRAGTGAYDCSFCGPVNRWGDYASATVDPGPWGGSYQPVQTDVWLAGEFSSASSDRQNWATAINRLTIAAPQVRSINTPVGPSSGGTSVVVSGSDFFSTGTAVSFGSAPATSVTFNSPDQLTAVSPAHVAGAVAITISTPLGQSSLPDAPQFTYLNPPSISGISPSSGTANSTPVTISGSNLAPDPQVLFGTVPAAAITSSSPTQIVAVPPTQSGAVSISVTTAGGTGTSPGQFTYLASHPAVSLVQPARGSSAGDNSVAILGGGLNGATAVKFGAASASSFHVDSDSGITAISPPGSGQIDVTVVSGPNTSALSSNDRFTYVPLTITGISPNSGPPSGGGTVTFTGTGFTANEGTGYTPSALFGNTPTPLNVIDDSHATTGVPSSNVVGPVPVKVCMVIGCSAPTSFTYVVSVSSVAPASGPTAGGTVAVIRGTGLSSVAAVKFGSHPATSFHVVSDGELDATSPSQPSGTVPISIALQDPSNPTASIAQFTYTAPAPSVGLLQPVRGPRWGGAEVRVTGSGFSFATSVSFSGVPSPAFHIDSDTQISAVSPAHATGTVNVVVTTAGGSSAITTADVFTYTDCVSPPSVARQFAFGAPCTGVTTFQYGLFDSDGATFYDIDPYRLSVIISPTVDSVAILGGNADLWTADAGYNQDIGISVNDTLVAWKESGGFAGTFSPNAAYVEAIYPMSAGHTYFVTLQWKTNKPAPGKTIVAGAGSGSSHSPTRLMARLVPASGLYSINSKVITGQRALDGSDGRTWHDVDPQLTIPFIPTVDGTAILSANADLWTSTAGYNQDVGINVNGGIAGWKESGGFAGTFSPNAAYLQTVYQSMKANTPYTVKLQWKSNKPSPATAKIWAGAGPIAGQYSPTSLTLYFVPGGVHTAWSTQQYSSSSDGTTWNRVDPEPTIQNRLQTQLFVASSCLYLVSANVDLWTSKAGYNQDIGISVTGGNYPTVVGQPEGWKESGGFAGTLSPNAAYLETVIALTPSPTYVITLTWKANKPATGATIWSGAGPINGEYSPTRLTLVPLC